jgi:hypothetical protein
VKGVHWKGVKGVVVWVVEGFVLQDDLLYEMRF